MKCVDTIARIRREFFAQGKTIKELVREMHVSRNTVRKVVRSGATAFEYERERQPVPGSVLGKMPWMASSHGAAKPASMRVKIPALSKLKAATVS